MLASELSTNLAAPARALIVPAHPDDAEFGAGGTVAKWSAAGCRVTYLVATDGSKGSWDPKEDVAELAARREAEQRDACSILGVSDLHFLRLSDGSVEPSLDLRRRLAEWIRMVEPEVVLTHDPWRPYEMHPDHRAVGQAVCDAVISARDPLFFPEQLEAGRSPARPAHILLWHAGQTDHVEELGEALMATKLAALGAHVSQHLTTMGHEGSGTLQAEEFEARIRAWCERVGSRAGFKYGEAFKILDATA